MRYGAYSISDSELRIDQIVCCVFGGTGYASGWTDFTSSAFSFSMPDPIRFVDLLIFEEEEDQVFLWKKRFLKY